MNFWNDQVLMSTVCNEFCQPTHLALPFYDSYAFEGYNVVSEVESQFDRSSFDSSQYQETQNQLSYYRKVNGESSRSWEESIRNENETAPKPNIVSKTRLKWTNELHQKFVDCVDELGGAQKATPKQLLDLMKVEGLTLIHIKSHLQKYRTSQQIQQFSKGKYERISKKEMVQPNRNIGKKLMETVRQQLETQISLDQQLLVQKNLSLAIEEQIKQLREVFEPTRKPVTLRNDERRK